jgi:hypothetical protein
LILAVLHSVLVHHPKHLRVKELLESVECFRVIESYLMANLKRREIQRVLDLCCGHGLLGLLIGYRFPHLQRVVCVDIAPSGAFADYKEAFARVEEAAVGSGKRCRNVELVTADARDVAITPDTLCVCIHGCNDISKVVLTRAVAGGASYAVMPCCIVDGLYGVAVARTGTSITNTHKHTHKRTCIHTRIHTYCRMFTQNAKVHDVYTPCSEFFTEIRHLGGSHRGPVRSGEGRRRVQ